MKTKVTILLGLTAIVTLSFTFANVSSPKSIKNQPTSEKTESAPIGGFASEEIVK